MAIGNVELMHGCFPKYSRMGTAIMKYDKETDWEGKKSGVCRERSKTGTKAEGVPTTQTILIIIILLGV